jgi:hypothetical protein
MQAKKKTRSQEKTSRKATSQDVEEVARELDEIAAVGGRRCVGCGKPLTYGYEKENMCEDCCYQWHEAMTMREPPRHMNSRCSGPWITNSKISLTPRTFLTASTTSVSACVTNAEIIQHAVTQMFALIVTMRASLFRNVFHLKHWGNFMALNFKLEHHKNHNGFPIAWLQFDDGTQRHANPQEVDLWNELEELRRLVEPHKELNRIASVGDTSREEMPQGMMSGGGGSGNTGGAYKSPRPVKK